MSANKYVIGLDYGTDSAMAIIVNTSNGDEVSSSDKNYPRWAKGKFCNPIKDQYRQHPLDYIEVMIDTVKSAIENLLNNNSIIDNDTCEKLIAESLDQIIPRKRI